jgi:hypothetical protein
MGQLDAVIANQPIFALESQQFAHSPVIIGSHETLSHSKYVVV